MAAKHNLTIEQGADFVFSFTYYPQGRAGDPQDWTGWTGSAELKDRAGGTELAAFTVTSDSAGVITLRLSAATTWGLRPGGAAFDVLMVRDSDNFAMRLLEGSATITAAVTD